MCVLSTGICCIHFLTTKFQISGTLLDTFTENTAVGGQVSALSQC